MAIDRTGALSNVKRHDYLPYGEELYAGMGGRTSQQGYVADNVRQKFTGYEYDANLEDTRRAIQDKEALEDVAHRDPVLAREMADANPMLEAVVQDSHPIAAPKDGKPVGPETDAYNCMGWALGYNDRKIYPT